MNNKKSNFLLTFVGIVVVAASCIALFIYAWKNLGLPTPGFVFPEINIWQVINFVLFQTFLMVVVFGCVLFLMKMVKKPVLNFLNRRWLPKEGQIIVKKGEVKNKEIYSASLGEEFEFLIRESQITMIIFKILPNFLKVSMLGIVISIVFNIVANFLKLGILPKTLISLVIFFIIFSLIGIDYLVKEWGRLHVALLFFSQNLINTYGGSGGLLGLITGSVSDFDTKKTPYSQIKEPEMANDPRAINNQNKPPNDLLNQIYQFLGKIRGLKCLYLPSINEKASDFFSFVEYGEGVGRIIDQIRIDSEITLGYLDLLQRKTNEIEIGKPDDKNRNPEESKLKAEEFFASRTSHLAKPSVFNIVSLLNEQESNVNKKWNIPEGERRIKRKNATNPQMDVSDYFEDEKVPFSENVSLSSEGQVVFPDKED